MEQKKPRKPGSGGARPRAGRKPKGKTTAYRLTDDEVKNLQEYRAKKAAALAGS